MTPSPDMPKNERYGTATAFSPPETTIESFQEQNSLTGHPRKKVETFDRLMESIGRCRMCGGAVSMDLDPVGQEAILETYNSLGPKFRAMLLQAHWVCDLCATADEQTQRAIAEKRLRRDQAQKARAWAYGSGAMGNGALDATFASSSGHLEWRNSAAWALARRWTVSDTNLWIIGPEGTGKSFMARCILNGALDRGYSAVEVSAFTLNLSADRYGNEALLERWSTSDVLLIDDVDKGYWSKKGLGCLWYVLDQRCTRRLRTIVTSNMSVEAVRDRWRTLVDQDNPTLLQTLIARLIPTTRVELTGESIRRAKPAAEPEQVVYDGEPER